MIAADTDVFVRLPTADEPKQTEQDRRLSETETVYRLKSVLLEAEWVLRGSYRQERSAVINAQERLIALPKAQCNDEAAVRQALAWARGPLDFADALHLASSRRASRFATCDLALIKGAKETGIDVTLP